MKLLQPLRRFHHDMRIACIGQADAQAAQRGIHVLQIERWIAHQRQQRTQFPDVLAYGMDRGMRSASSESCWSASWHSRCARLLMIGPAPTAGMGLFIAWVGPSVPAGREQTNDESLVGVDVLHRRITTVAMGDGRSHLCRTTYTVIGIVRRICARAATAPTRPGQHRVSAETAPNDDGAVQRAVGRDLARR